MEAQFPKINATVYRADGTLRIVSRVAAAMRLAGADQDQINQFSYEASRGTRKQAIATAKRWVSVHVADKED